MLVDFQIATLIAPLSPAAAFERLWEERARLCARQLLPINVNVPRAVGTVLRAVDALRPLQPELDSTFAGRDPCSLEKLELCALALFHAHVVWSATPALASDQELRAQALRLREMLMLDLQALATRGIVRPCDLELVSRSRNARHLALDLGVLSAIIRDGWPCMLGKTALRLEDAASAQRLSTALFDELAALRRQSSPQQLAASQRRRAFTLLARSYDEARDELTYLRRECGDADRFAPSLYTGRRR